MQITVWRYLLSVAVLSVCAAHRLNASAAESPAMAPKHIAAPPAAMPQFSK